MGVPVKYAIVIRVGYNMTINWSSQDISEVNIIFVRRPVAQGNNEEIHIDRRPSYNGRNSYTFTINDSMFTENYNTCFIKVVDANTATIDTDSETFQILRGL